MLTRILDVSQAGWIEESTLRLADFGDPTWRGNFVAHRLPSYYPAYCKIFHPIYVDPKIKDRSLSWPEFERSLDQDEADRQTDEAMASTRPEHRIRWSQLASELGLVFHPELCTDVLWSRCPQGFRPRYLLGPEQGSLDRFACTALVRSVAPFAKSESCFFFYVVYANRLVEPLLFQGNIEDAQCAVDHPSVYTSPGYWWPTSRLWCICTDYDLDFTLVGGPEALVSALLCDPEIESVAVTPHTRIDRYSDRLNAK